MNFVLAPPKKENRPRVPRLILSLPQRHFPGASELLLHLCLSLGTSPEKAILRQEPQKPRQHKVILEKEYSYISPSQTSAAPLRPRRRQSNLVSDDVTYPSLRISSTFFAHPTRSENIQYYSTINSECTSHDLVARTDRHIPISACAQICIPED